MRQKLRKEDIANMKAIKNNKEQRHVGERGIRFFKVLGLTAILLSVLGLGTISQVEKSVSVEIPDLPADCTKQGALDLTCQVPTGSTLKFTVRGVAVPSDRVELFAEGLPANASFRCTPTSRCSGTGSISETFSFTPTTDQGGRAFLVTFKATASGLTDVKRVRFNVAPRASFRTNPFNAPVNAPVTFDASSSLALPGRRIERYSWDFGDGSRPQEVTTPIIQHTYTQAGTFIVRLTVSDSGGAQATASATLTVIRPEDVQRVRNNIISTLPILTAPEPVTLDPPKILESIQKGEVVELPILGKGNRAEGVPVRLEPNPLGAGPIVTFKGSATIEGQPNSVVRLTVTRSFISGYILMDGLWSFIEPLDQFQISPAGTPFNHFVYNATGNNFKLDLSMDAPPRAGSSGSSQLNNYPQGAALQALSHPPSLGLPMPPSELAITATAAQQAPEPFFVLLQPLSLKFKAVERGKNPEPQKLTIKNNLDGSLSWSVSAKDHAGQPLPWLTLTPSSGSLSPRGGEASIMASINIAGLSQKFFQGRITINAGGAKKELDVSLLICPSGDECLLERELPIAFVVDEEFRRLFLQKVRITAEKGQEQEIERWKLEPQSLSNFVEGIFAFTQPCLPQGTFRLQFRLVPQDQKEPPVIDVRETDGLRLRKELAEKLRGEQRFRDALLVHLLTGKDLKLQGGPLFGVAWQAPQDELQEVVVAGLGTPYNQSISQMAPEPPYLATLYQRVILIAHELGHSLGAVHVEDIKKVEERKREPIAVPEECLGDLAKLTFPAGSTVATGDSDVGNALVPFDSKEKYLDENNNGAYDPEEIIYRDENGDGGGTVSAEKDKRLNGCGQGFPVDNKDPNINKALRPFATSEKHTDQGNNRYDLGENIYKDVDNDGRVSSGDIRLMAVGSLLKPNLMCRAFTGDHLPAFGLHNDSLIREVLRQRISK